VAFVVTANVLAGAKRDRLRVFLTIVEVKMNAESQDLAPSCVCMLSEGFFAAQCSNCLRFSLPVNAIGPEHAWSELLKEGWTWQKSPVRGSGHASCLQCLRASAPNRRPCPS
jgi:hypothetical protein